MYPRGWRTSHGEPCDPRVNERYATAKELFDEVQEYIEGARDLERAYHRSTELTDDARLRMSAYFRLKERLGWHQMELKEAAQHFQGWESLEDKRELWRAERRVERARHELLGHFSSATELLTRALTYQPDNRSAREYLADLYWSRFHEADEQGQDETADVFRALVEQYHDGKYALELVGDGQLELETSPPGARAMLYEYRESNRLLVPSEPHSLGNTPLTASVKMGSYLLLLSLPGFRDVRYPISIERMGQQKVHVRLYEDSALGQGFVYVPEGKFIMGTNEGIADAVERCTPYLQDFVTAVNPVSFAEYREFLNALAASDPDLARQHAPRLSDGRNLWELRPNGRFTLPERDREGISHQPTLPIFGIFLARRHGVRRMALATGRRELPPAVRGRVGEGRPRR